MASAGAGPLVPTFNGYVSNTMDGLLLFEACLSGKLQHVPRRPHERERSSLVKSGSIFIYEENASGIKRWTDGIAWSPSRILGNFLIYRELQNPFPPGEKKRAMKRKRTSVSGDSRRESTENDGSDVARLPTPSTPPEVKTEATSSDHDKELERSLIGSLVDSYGFRDKGLVKKTFSIVVNGISHHMVSYYKVDDVKAGLLQRPMQDPRLQNVSVRPDLYLKQNFRSPIEDTDLYAFDSRQYAHPQMMYQMPATATAYPVRSYFGGQYPNAYQSPIAGANLYGGQYTNYASATPGANYTYSNPSTAANYYNGVTTSSWPGQTSTAGALPAMSYAPQTASTIAYNSQPYANYYRPSSQSGGPVRTEDGQASSQAMAYAQQYQQPYSGQQIGAHPLGRHPQDYGVPNT